MAIKVIERPPVCIVRLMEDFTIKTAVATKNELEEIFLAGSKIGELIVDLSKIGEVDTSGISAIIAAMIFIRAKGIRVMLYHPADHAQEVMDLMEIDGFFPLIFSSEDLMSRLLD